MLDYSDIKPKRVIVLDNEPYEVLSSQTKKKNRQKPSNQTKLKNLLTQSVIEKTFHQSDRVEEADIDTKEVVYLYNNKGSWWFADSDNLGDRFERSFEGTFSRTLDGLGRKAEKVLLKVKDISPMIKWFDVLPHPSFWNTFYKGKEDEYVNLLISLKNQVIPDQIP